MAHSETTPQGDLATMTAKAAGDPILADMLRRFTQGPSGDQRRMMMRQMLMQFPVARDGEFDTPIHYANAGKVWQAQRRAQVMSQLLSADLDNDGQITKQEVRDTLEFNPQQGAAQAFFTSDKNDDSILQPDEIRAAVDMQMGGMGDFGGRGDQLRLFDFDDDGYLAPEEFTRATKALGL